MEDKKPIKRSEELVPLSRDHHSGLLLCWKIKTGVQKAISADRIANYVVFYYRSHLEEHFRQEEEYIFPLPGNEDPLIQKAVAEHHEIKGLITQLEKETPNGYENLQKLMN